MQKEVITTSAKQTQKLGKKLSQEIQTGGIICLTGELGAGKTTFAQGILKGLKIEGPYTSPTFVIMKQYKKKIPNSKSQITNKFKIHNVYHIDAYRVNAEDILNLGWKEIIANSQNIVIIEWADRIKKIIPNKDEKSCVSTTWIEFFWKGKNKRKIKINLKHKNRLSNN